MDNNELAFAPAYELRELLDSRKVSSVELTEMYLGRIEELNPVLNAYLTVCGEEALESARRADTRIGRRKGKGKRKGGDPLLGIPVSIKDLELTKGIRSTMGSLAYRNYVPKMDSITSERVRSAGAVILGKTNTPEFGLLGTTENRLGDACRNPWNIDRTSGGSSGGAAAALVAGLCALATGSDGGGSIRIPSSFCGVYGIKPSLGRVAKYGGVGNAAPNFTSQSGPMARNVRDAATLLQALSGYDSRDIGAMREEPPDFVASMDEGIEGLKVAWSADLGYAAVDPEVASIAYKGAKVFEELGCEVEEPTVSLQHPIEYFMTIFSTGAYVSYKELYQNKRQLLTSYVRGNMALGEATTGEDFVKAMYAYQRLRSQADDVMEEYDLLLTPTMSVPAFPIGQFPREIAGQKVDPRLGYMPYTPVFNLTGQPAASVPCGFTEDGMPIGLHIVGRRGEETTVLRASAAFEAARPWADLRPAVC